MVGYNTVPQADAEVASNASDDSHHSQPALKDSLSFEPLSIDFENLGGESFMSDAKIAADTNERTSVLSLRSGIIGRSRGTSASYDIVEDDDYNDHQVTDTDDPAYRSSQPIKAARDTSPEPPLRSRASTSSVPLAHPTPDLQAIQGAYVGNVERLEKSAQNFEVGLGSEIPAPLSEHVPRPGSVHSIGRSVPGRSRGFSASSKQGSITGDGNTTGPRSSVYSQQGSAYGSPKQSFASRTRSGSVASRLAMVMEPVKEDQGTQQFPVVPILPPPDALLHGQSTRPRPYQSVNPDGAPLDEPSTDRPGSRGSTDTYRQATNLFRDFDGVHFTPHELGLPQPRRISLSKPPLASDAQPYKEPQPGQNLVYYPAPVPAVLNLPSRLSKKPAPHDQEKRRTQDLDSFVPNNRKSASWFPITEDEQAQAQAQAQAQTATAAARESKRASQLPQLARGSSFFDPDQVQLDLEANQNSAVATLDSILDAAAHAPVSAFTDHPIVGHLGADVYGYSDTKKKQKEEKRLRKHRSLAAVGGARESIVPLSKHDRTGSRAGGLQHESHDQPTFYGRDGRPEYDEEEEDDFNDGMLDSESDESDEDGQGRDNALGVGRPTTLLAELQIRKKEQKQRTRTAATAFPNGMHSTLLELDAVAQRQRATRKDKHVTLAWEDPGPADAADSDDDDVPLGVLFPETNKEAEEQRPKGLMEQLQLEENEPLSRRRARIRGEKRPQKPEERRQSPVKRDSVAYTLDMPAFADNNDEVSDEEETLAQRLRRLKAREAGDSSGRPTSDFASEILSKFELESEKPKAEHGGDEEEEEETLGQRRKRLQAEAARNRASSIQHSMGSASVFAAHPASHPVGNGLQQQQHPGAGPAAPSIHGFQMSGMPTTMSQVPPPAAGYPMVNNTVPYQSPYAQPNATPYGNGMSAMHPAFYPNDAKYRTAYPEKEGELQPTIDPKQRAMIDRWRLSVR